LLLSLVENHRSPVGRDSKVGMAGGGYSSRELEDTPELLRPV